MIIKLNEKLYNVIIMSLNSILIDIGNTSVDIKYDKKNFKFYKENKNEIINLINSLDCKRLIISSVNKKTFKMISSYYLKKKYEIVVLDKDTMINYAKDNNYDIPNLNILGSDLFCDLVASDLNSDYIIIDLGTVGKILVLNKERKFLGGIIIPGITSFPKSVSDSTDLNISELNAIDVDLLNYDTDKCVFSGSINGTASMLYDLVHRLIEKYRLINAKIVLCGGNSYFVEKTLRRFGLTNFEYNPKLVLVGLGKIYSCGGKNEIKKD